MKGFSIERWRETNQRFPIIKKTMERVVFHSKKWLLQVCHTMLPWPNSVQDRLIGINKPIMYHILIFICGLNYVITISVLLQVIIWCFRAKLPWFLFKVATCATYSNNSSNLGVSSIVSTHLYCKTEQVIFCSLIHTIFFNSNLARRCPYTLFVSAVIIVTSLLKPTWISHRSLKGFPPN